MRAGNPAPTYSLITKPTGMTIDTVTGIISWTAGSPGNYNVKVEAHNGVSPACSNNHIQ